MSLGGITGGDQSMRRVVERLEARIAELERSARAIPARLPAGGGAAPAAASPMVRMVQIAGGSTDFGSGYKGLIPADLSSLGINLLTGGENLATCTITASGGGGAGFACTCTITGGVVTLVTVTNAGSGYVSIPTPVITTTAIPDTTKVDPTVEFTIGFPVFTTLPNPDTVDPLTLPQGLGTCYMWIYRNDGTGGLVNKNDEPTIMEKAFCVYQNPYDGGFQPMFEGGRFYSHGYVTLTDNTGASVKAWIISFR